MPLGLHGVDLSIVLATGALLVAVSFVAGFWARARVADPAGVQTRTTLRETARENRDLKDQIKAVRDVASRLAVDPRTREGTRLVIEEQLLPRLQERRRS